MFCEQCGKEIKEDAVFCGECGTKVGAEDETQTVNSVRNDRSREQDTVMVNNSQNIDPAFQKVQQPGPEQPYNYFSGNHFDPPQPPKDEKQTSLPLMMALGGIIVLLVAGIIWGVVTLVNMNKETEDDTYVAPAINNEAAAQESDESSKGLFEEEVEIKSAVPEVTQEAEDVTRANPTPVPTQAPTQAPVQTPAQVPSTGYSTDSDYIIADSSSRYLTANDLYGLSAWEIKIARNEIYARNGRIFESSDLDNYFRGKSWYVPSIAADQFKESYLSSLEFDNVKFIVKYEKDHGINQ